MLRRVSTIGLLAVPIVAAFQIPDPQTATFHAGTRLVEVDVVVRNKNGPISGLTKGDFTVLDQGKPQRIDVFHAGPAGTGTATPSAPLAPGVVSNRVNRTGQPLPSATVVLFDQLNTGLDLKAYERQGMLKLIRGLGPRDRVAIYALGRSLHVLQDLTDDPQKLLAAISHLDSGRDLMPANIADALFDFPTDMTGRIDPPKLVPFHWVETILNTAGTNAQFNATTNDRIAIEALMRIVRHLSGISGRRNLIWIKEDPVAPPPVIGMLLQNNIALYPVLIRSIRFSAPDFMPKPMGVVDTTGIPVDFMATQAAGRALAAMTGGAGFDDAGDLQLALKTAEEDSFNAYTLGFYPAEDALDGMYHRLTVTVAREKSSHLEVRYRPGYIATRQEAVRPAPPLADAIAELAANPLDVTAIGLTAQVRPDTQPGLYQVRVTVDLRDVHLKREGNRSMGKIELVFPLGDSARVRTMNLDLTDDQLAEALKTGLVTVSDGIQSAGDAIRVVVRDPSTGITGSLRIPLR